VAVIRLIFVEAVARRGRGEGSKRAQSDQCCKLRGWLRGADCVEKLVVFDPLMLVITLISFGCS
jgi:hypothetical protein